MLSKFLITIFVIAVAFIVLRQRSTKKSEVSKNARPAGPLGTAGRSAKKTEKDELSQDLRLGAYLFLALTAAIGAGMYYFQWQDDHTVLTVNLYRDTQLTPVSYKVYKYQLSDKSFVTVDGLSVAVASSERMEITGLE